MLAASRLHSDYTAIAPFYRLAERLYVLILFNEHKDFFILSLWQEC